MEPLDPTKNDDGIGFPKQRISSILKASRKSIRFSDPEQQENVKVECAKPVEKRMSRRVSFAPADDVLLFTKDVKNAPSLLQDLMTPTAAAATQNRVQMAVTEDGMQQITGMETLLNAPLHASQQRDKINFDIGADFGEKTVMFSTDDAFMDMTHCHTINIASDGELLADTALQNDDALPTRGEKIMMFSVGDGSMDMTQSHTVNIASGSLLTSRNISAAPSFDPRFQSFLAGLSKAGGPSSTETNCSLVQSKTQWPDVDKENQAPTHQRHKANFDGCREKTIMFTAGDDFMDVTQCHTVNIGSASLAPPNKTLDFFHTRGTKENTSSVAMLHERKCETGGAPGLSANGLDPGFKNFLSDLFGPSGNPPPAASTQETVNTNSSLSQLKINVGKENRSLNTTRSFGESFHGEAVCPKDDVSMDMTEAQTCLIESDDPFQCLFPTQDMYKNRESLKKRETISGQKNSEVLGSLNRTGMETSLKPSLKTKVQRNLVKLDAEDDCREKTVRFTADDGCMDVMRSPSVNIDTNFKPQSHQKVDFLPTCGEKMTRFTADDTCMDVTGSHTVNIDTSFKLSSNQNVNFLPAYEEKKLTFTTTDATMDMTQCLTVNIDSDAVSESHSEQDLDILATHQNMDFPLSVKKTHRPLGNRSSSAHALNPGFKNSLSRMSGPWANPLATIAPAAPSLQETDTNGLLDQLTTLKPDVDAEKEAPVMEKSVNKTMTYSPEDDISMDMTEAQTGCILEQTYTDEPPQCVSSTQDLHPNSDHLKKAEVISQQSNEARGSSNPDGLEITNLPDSLDSDDTKKEPRNQTLTPKMGSPPSVEDHDVDAAPSQKSRRKSLADLQSKLRRLSNLINTAPDDIPMGSCTAPLPQLEQDTDKNLTHKTTSPPVPEPELQIGLVNSEENTQTHSLIQGEQPFTATATPFKLQTKQLMSRLSVGSFKAKLPQRSKPDDPKKVNSVGEHTRTITVNVADQLSNFDGDVSDINDEELGSYEDMSETLDIMSPQKATEEALQKFNTDEVLEDSVFGEDFVGAVQGEKRPLPEDENNVEDEKRMKTSDEVASDVETVLLECDGNITTVPIMTSQTADYSNHTTSSRCEATFESTFKHSLFESQLEDYTSDVHRKLDDGTITVLEFFKLFSIDFVIHNPRQSVLPTRFLSDTERTPMDLLIDRHINRPKQLVYETDVLNLTEKVEGLKERMQDLDKPLKIVNRPLWEEVRNSSEKELKSFGAKLKERNNLFRKMSKVQSHEMKEVLYANVVQANLEEQQKLRGMTEEADKMIKSLDDCICELETELVVVEEKGFEDKPSLKSLQKEMQKVTEALLDNERQISELEMQKTQNSSTLKRLQAETRNLESHITMMHLVNEWKFGEKRDNCTVYTFLYDTLHLQLVYEKSDGNDADNQSDRKIIHITFKHQLDDEKSWGHACLIHKLLSQYIEGETDWVQKYPTSRHVPQLLHDVSLVVSRCRLLGEELRLLKMWGGLRLNILDIRCVDTQVHIVFSSLKASSKFEVNFCVSLINHFYALQVENFKNTIGNTTMQQIEEIVASFSPGKNLLTKIVKKIHENLLC